MDLLGGLGYGLHLLDDGGYLDEVGLGLGVDDLLDGLGGLYYGGVGDVYFGSSDGDEGYALSRIYFGRRKRSGLNVGGSLGSFYIINRSSGGIYLKGVSCGRLYDLRNSGGGLYVSGFVDDDGLGFEFGV